MVENDNKTVLYEYSNEQRQHLSETNYFKTLWS